MAQLQTVLEHRAVIETPNGMLMAARERMGRME